MYSGKEEHRERDCREQICKQKRDEEELDEPPPDCNRDNEETRGWMHTLGLDSSNNEAGLADDRMLLDSRAGRSGCPPQRQNRHPEQRNIERRTEQRSSHAASQPFVCAGSDTLLTHTYWRCREVNQHGRSCASRSVHGSCACE